MNCTFCLYKNLITNARIALEISTKQSFRLALAVYIGVVEKVYAVLQSAAYNAVDSLLIKARHSHTTESYRRSVCPTSDF